MTLGAKINTEIKDDVDACVKLFANAQKDINYIEPRLDCEKINDYYNEIVYDSCQSFKNNIFFCLIFQWACLWFILFSRMAKCKQPSERTESIIIQNEGVVNDMYPQEEFYSMSSNRRIVISSGNGEQSSPYLAHIVEDGEGPLRSRTETPVLDGSAAYPHGNGSNMNELILGDHRTLPEAPPAPTTNHLGSNENIGSGNSSFFSRLVGGNGNRRSSSRSKSREPIHTMPLLEDRDIVQNNTTTEESDVLGWDEEIYFTNRQHSSSSSDREAPDGRSTLL